MTTTNSALSHLRILDLSRILAGPWAAQSLADLGAEVVKVENPNGGDDTRKWGPPFVEDVDGNMSDAAYYTAANRNKRSVAIDFRTDEGSELVRKLAATSDVVIENYKLDGLKKYALDYDSLRAVKSDLIYCSITGFGQTGPWAHRPGYDFLLQAMGGLMSITGEADSTSASRPQPLKTGVAVCDLFTGMYAAVSILAAIAHRDRSGEGQHIDLALMDGQVAMLANQGANWLVGNEVPQRMGNQHPNLVPYGVYPVKDGHIIIACGNDAQFQRLSSALGDTAMAADDRFKDNANRVANRDALDQRIGESSRKLGREEIVDTLEAAGVPYGPINNIKDVFDSEHAKAHELAVPMQRPDGTEVTTIAFPARLSKTPASYRHAPPTLGSDTDSVLAKVLGLDATEIRDLRQAGIVG